MSHNLLQDDRIEHGIEIIDNDSNSYSLNPITKLDTKRSRVGFIINPSFKNERTSPLGYAGDCNANEILWWDESEALKVLQQQELSFVDKGNPFIKFDLLKVEVTPLIDLE